MIVHSPSVPVQLLINHNRSGQYQIKIDEDGEAIGMRTGTVNLSVAGRTDLKVIPSEVIVGRRNNVVVKVKSVSEE